MASDTTGFNDELMSPDASSGNASWVRFQTLVCSRKGAYVAGGLVAVVLLLSVATGRTDRSRNNGELNWSSCASFFEQDSEYWSSESPCLGAENSRCAYVNGRAYAYCDQQYYESNDQSYNNGNDDGNNGGWEWTLVGSDGNMAAVWEESRDCDTLGFSGWENKCSSIGVDDGDMDNSDCMLNQWRGYISCDGSALSFRYEDGTYTRTEDDE